MVGQVKPQGYRRQEDMRAAETEQALYEQEIIDAVTETLESTTSPITMNEITESKNRSFLSTVVGCAPYIIMGMGVYMIWTRARAIFKPTKDDKREAEG